MEHLKNNNCCHEDVVNLKPRFWISLVLYLLLIFFHSYLLHLMLASFIVFWGGYPFLKNGFKSVLNKNANMFTLISLGVLVSFFYSLLSKNLYFESSSGIIVLVLLGQILEEKAKAKTLFSIQKLLSLLPDADRKITVGDLIQITPGEKIPADGVIIEGNSLVDESMLTGETELKEKSIKDIVFAGTINQAGSFTFKVDKIYSETLIFKIVELVKKASEEKSHIQKLVDKISYFFIPIVIFISFVSFFCWYFLCNNLNMAIFASVSVLIIACPCALGIATPMSIMVAIGKAAKNGILIKESQSLELLSKINVLVLDKTGTITKGTPKLTQIISLNEKYSENDLLALCATLEQRSEHPIAFAILEKAKENNIKFLSCTEFKYTIGQGVEGLINGNLVKIKKHEIYINNNLCGLIKIEDVIKPSIKELIKTIKNYNIKVFMLTGDNNKNAFKIGKEVGLDEREILAEVLPNQKYEFIEQLQKKGNIVAMAGDGINDAPALKKAHIGISMGTGTDIAMESSSMVIISGDTFRILNAYNLSKNTIKNIKQNLFLAFIYNIIAIPVASFGFLNPVIASFLMALSSISVIINSLRLTTKI